MASGRRALPGLRAAGIVLLPAWLLAACPGCGADEYQAPPAPGHSVLLVSLDTTRADALGSFGGPDFTTPQLDRLAETGVRFRQARSVAPVTLPSHASLLTGVFPYEHGVRDNGSFRLPDEIDTLAERFRAAGYRTGAVVAAFVLHSSFGLDQGFDDYLDAPRSRLEFGAEPEERSASQVVDAAQAWLGEGGDPRPFFLWVHFFDPHHPYQAPPEVLEALPPAHEIPGSEGLPPSLAAMRRHYLAEVAALDREIGRLLDAARRRAPGRLLTVVVADHGEGLGDHDEFSHGYLLHDAVLRIPLLFHHPGLRKGRVVDEPVSIADVAPTLASLLELEGSGMSGADLSQLLLDPQPVPLVTGRPVYMETFTPWLGHGWSPLYALVTGSWKTVIGPRSQVFDLTVDPREDRNLAEQHPERLAAGRQQLQELSRRLRGSQRRGLSGEERERLEALGYVATPAVRQASDFAPGWLPDAAEHPAEAMASLTRYWQAEQALATGHREEGLALLRELVEAEPEDPYLLGNAGALLTNHGHEGEALPLLRRAVALAPDPESRLALAATLVRLEREPEAARVLLETIRLHPELLAPRLRAAELLVALGRGEEAVPHLERFLQELEGTGPLRQRGERLLAAARRPPQPPGE